MNVSKSISCPTGISKVNSNRAKFKVAGTIETTLMSQKRKEEAEIRNYLEQKEPVVDHLKYGSFRIEKPTLKVNPIIDTKTGETLRRS